MSRRGVAAAQARAEEEEEEEEEEDEEDVDGDDEGEDDGDDEEEEEEEEDDDDEDEDEDEEFEQQSSDEDEDVPAAAQRAVDTAESAIRDWGGARGGLKMRNAKLEQEAASGSLGVQRFMHTDDLSSDDEEDVGGNTIGRVPLHWYDAYDHIGYSIDGSKVAKRKGKDRIDTAIDNRDDPAAARTIYDMYNDREVVLSERDLEIIRRMQAGAFAHPEHDDMPDYVPYVSSEIEAMPIWANPEPKRHFIPSKWEFMKVVKIIKAMREGRYKTLAQLREEKKAEKAGQPLRMLWNEEEDEILAESKRNQYHLPAPKLPLPGHAESYNPPKEYLLSEEEKAQQDELDPDNRKYNFTPKTHACLRHVAGYDNFVRERFERCLDLYLCPRKLKKRLNIDPETLVPRLPRPRELKPFPNSLCLQYLGHKKPVRSISVSPDGQYLVSGSDDGTVRLWETDTCLCRCTWALGRAVKGDDGVSKMEPILVVAWNPNPSHHVVAVAVGSRVVLVSTGTGDADSAEVTEALLLSASAAAGSQGGAKEEDDEEGGDGEDEDEDEDDKEGGEGGKSSSSSSSSGGKRKQVCTWHSSSEAIEGKKAKQAATAGPTRHGAAVGPRSELRFAHDVSAISWHHKGDYLGTVVPGDGTKSVAIHQVSKAKTQTPFGKNPGLVQTVAFHPSRPFLFVVTQQHVKVFNLVEQKMVKRLLSNCKWLSCVAIHPSGDHCVLGSYDRRVVWFDLDLSSTPYKTLKFHEKAVRHVSFHQRYPLMVSASDDGSVHVFHATVYSDLTKNPLIVPLKVLRGHGVVGGVGVLCTAFHPKQPWVFSSGADGVVNLYQDL